MPEKRILLDMTPGELGAYFKELGQPAFRAGQVYSLADPGRSLFGNEQSA